MAGCTCTDLPQDNPTDYNTEATRDWMSATLLICALAAGYNEDVGRLLVDFARQRLCFDMRQHQQDGNV